MKRILLCSVLLIYASALSMGLDDQDDTSWVSFPNPDVFTKSSVSNHDQMQAIVSSSNTHAVDAQSSSSGPSVIHSDKKRKRDDDESQVAAAFVGAMPQSTHIQSMQDAKSVADASVGSSKTENVQLKKMKKVACPIPLCVVKPKESNLAGHLRLRHIYGVDAYLKVDPAENNYYECPNCQKTMQRELSFARHMEKEHSFFSASNLPVPRPSHESLTQHGSYLKDVHGEKTVQDASGSQ